MKKILITGGGGYVGSVLCRHLLKNNFRVRVIDNFHKGHCDSLIPMCSNKNFEFYNGDITNKEQLAESLEDVDAVVHLAAIVGFPACSDCPILAEEVNVKGSANLANLTDKPIMFASTGSVYGKVEEICTEETPLNTLSLYGQTKLQAEKILLNRGNCVIYRFATGYGVSGNMTVSLLINDLVNQAVNNKCFVVFEPEARRTFIHVKDMANSFLFALNNLDKMRDSVYNVGDEKGNWTKRQMADYIADKTGAYLHYADFGKDLDCRDYEVSYKKIQSMGWQTKYTIEQGIDELIKAVKLIRINHQYQ